MYMNPGRCCKLVVWSLYLFRGVGTLMVMNIYSGTIEYVFNDMETLNMMMLIPLKSMESILFKYYMIFERALETLACGVLGS